MLQTKVTIDSIVHRWESSDRPLFKGQLINDNCIVCAQGDVLRVAGYSDEKLRTLTQTFADTEVANILDISRVHSILLRQVNDRQDGCPQDVLAHPEKILGDKAPLLLIFWKKLDTLSNQEWLKISDAARAAARDAARDAAWAAASDAARAAARDAARDAAWDAAWAAASDAAWYATWDAAWYATWDAAWAAAWAANEIQGMEKLKTPPYFLKFFGINSFKELQSTSCPI